VLPPPANVVRPGGSGLDQQYKADLRVAIIPSSSTTAKGKLRIYELAPIYLSAVKVQAYAHSLLRLPARLPAELRVPRLLIPAPAVTVTGVPGGDLTADVAEYAYEHSSSNLTTTTVKLEQNGASETARILRLVAQDRATDTGTTSAASWSADAPVAIPPVPSTADSATDSDGMPLPPLALDLLVMKPRTIEYDDEVDHAVESAVIQVGGSGDRKPAWCAG